VDYNVRLAGAKIVGFQAGRHRVKRKMPNRGFTLVELLVVISVVSILSGILLPALSKARDQARKLLGASNQRQIVSAVSLFAADNDHPFTDGHPEFRQPPEYLRTEEP